MRVRMPPEGTAAARAARLLGDRPAVVSASQVMGLRGLHGGALANSAAAEG
jgi:hypothetical protein